MSSFGNRDQVDTKRSKLERMAAQSASPNEAAIARRKIAEARELEQDEAWREAWADYREHERIGERQAAASREDEIASIVRRWEHGTYSGMTFESGAANTGRRA